jgi:fucose permease
VLLLLVFIFLYAGMEVQYGTFVATFAVKSDLSLTRQEGAKVNAIFWGSFAAMRFAAIFISFKMSALSQMMLSFTLCAVGSIYLAIAGNIYKYGLFVCSALMGTGMASVYACGILWIEQHITVTNRIISSMIISGSVGADLFPIILGQFMATFPMLLMYLQVAVVFMCIALFSTAYGITRIINKNKTTKIIDENEELQAMSS